MNPPRGMDNQIFDIQTAFTQETQPKLHTYTLYLQSKVEDITTEDSKYQEHCHLSNNVSLLVCRECIKAVFPAFIPLHLKLPLRSIVVIARA